ncbi:MAG: Gfo/Idh/MocA family oxidoreductase [Candidatus Latescibacteria bacterium]|jgi:predicted dehydrogenase|nr:Gfo/Idh/MocA family oxidoreductase [Candidatus Latescibacterota bacterium]
MSKIKLAMVGCGGMGGTHMRRFQTLRERVELTAAVDVVREKAEAVTDQFPGATVATDFHEVLDDVDAVLLALPHHLHFSVAQACLEAGKHVLLEKPMANYEVACKELIQTAEAKKRVLMIAYCMRFHPLVMRMKELLDQKTYGDVFQVSIWTEQLTRYPEDHWASSKERLGGGQLFSHGCHYIDLLLWFLGRPIKGMHMGTNLGTPWMEREGTSNVTLEFENGRLGYHFGTWGARGSRLRYAIHAHCTEGMIEADITNGRLVYIHRGEETVLLDAESGKHTENEMAHFLDCIETGQQPLTDGIGSLQGLRVIWKLYEAENEGRIADLTGLGLDEV